MNDLELNSVAEGVFAYLQSKSESPLDGIAILGMTLLRIFDEGTDGTLGIERFAEAFKRSLLLSYKAKSAEGPGTMQ